MREDGGRGLPAKMANRDKEELEAWLCAHSRAGDTARQSFHVNWQASRHGERIKTEVKKNKCLEKKEQRIQDSNGQSEREWARARDYKQDFEKGRARGKECADVAFLVWTPQINNQQRFSRAVPGTGAYCQAPGQARPSLPPPSPSPIAPRPALGPNRRRCLSGPSRAWHTAMGLLLVQEFWLNPLLCATHAKS